MITKVTLRQKPNANNKESLYLDFYPPIHDPDTGKCTRRHFLNLSLFSEIEREVEVYFDKHGKEQKRLIVMKNAKGNPKKIQLSPADKIHNYDTIQLAKQIRNKFEKKLNGNADLNDLERKLLEKDKIEKEKGEKNFVDYFQLLSNKRIGTSNDNWLSALHYLKKFSGGYLKFSDLDEKKCNDFKDYLMTVPSNRSSKAKLSQNTALSYFNKFKAALKQAFKDGFLQIDINGRIDPIKEADTMIHYLTEEELEKLRNTECPNQTLRRASLFSAATGMAFKELENLTWGDIQCSHNEYTVIFKRQKTQKFNHLPISDYAYSILGTPGLPMTKVFDGICNRDRYHFFAIWIAKAQINKHVTFHGMRHTFAVHFINRGGDIYTLKELLGHSDIKMTMRYVKMLDQTKRDAVNRISEAIYSRSASKILPITLAT